MLWPYMEPANAFTKPEVFACPDPNAVAVPTKSLYHFGW